MELRLENWRTLWALLSFFAIPAQLESAEWEPVRVLGTAGFQHADTISEVFALPDGKRVVTACGDGSARLWEVESGKELQRYVREDSDTIWSVRLLAGGEEVLTAGKDGFITRWETATGKQLMTYEQKETVFRLAVRPGEKEFVAVGAGNKVVLWDVETGDEVRSFEGHSESVYAAVFLSGGKSLLTGGSDEMVKLWDLETGKCEKTLKEEFKDIYTLALSPDESSVALCTSDNRVCLLDAETLKEVWSKKLDDGVKVVSWSPNGNSIVGASDDDLLLIWNAETGKVSQEIKLPDSSHRGVGYDRSGEEIFVGCGGVLARFSVESGKRVSPTRGLPVYVGGIETVVMTGNGESVSASDREVLVPDWNVATGESTLQISRFGRVWSMAISPDGEHLALGYDKGTVDLLNRKTGKVSRTFSGDARKGKDFEGTVKAVAFDEKGEVLVAGSARNQMMSWEVASGRVLQEFRGHNNDVNDVVIVPDGETLMSASDDETVRMWNLRSGAEIKKLEWKKESVEGVVSLEQGRSFVASAQDENLRGFIAKTETQEVVLTREELEELIQKLGAEKYVDRKVASELLIKQGSRVMPILEASRPDDPEVVFRIREIKGKIRRGGLGDEMKLLHTFTESVHDLVADRQGEQWAVVVGSGVHAKVMIGRVVEQKLVIDQTIADGHGAAVLAFSGNGEHLSVGNEDGTISVFGRN